MTTLYLAKDGTREITTYVDVHVLIGTTATVSATRAFSPQTEDGDCQTIHTYR